MLANATPVLPVLNIDNTITFFERQLGFFKVYSDVEYGIVRRDDVEIHFWRCTDKMLPENSSCRIAVTGIEKLYDGFQKGVIRAPLEAKSWGMNEFAAIDPDGNLIWFVERIPQ